MTRRLAFLLCAMAAAPALAHITPPVLLVSDRDAVAGLLAGARRYFVREVRLTPAERQGIKKDTGWAPDEDFYRFYIGRDEGQHDVGAVTFLTEYTIHGPVRVAVALAPDGKVKGAAVAEVSEETYPWVKTLIDRGFLASFAGRDAHASFTAGAGGGSSMPRFYGEIIGGLVQRAALLYEAGVLKREHRLPH
jgi:hypothetical protein